VEILKNKKSRRDKLRIVLKIICYLTLILGVYLSIILFYPIGAISEVFVFIIPQIGGFLIILFLLTILLLLKLTPKIKKVEINREDLSGFINKLKNKNYKRRIIVIVGFSIIFLNSLPLITTPIAISNAELEFEDAYGSNWREKIPKEIESYFLQSQFNLAYYFLGIPQKECNIDINIKYYEDNDLGIELYFDVYYPKATKRELPGHNSTIIKIHGGGWTQGDKSIANMLWVNKYLAAQGYIVFDIQYGLLDNGEKTYLPTPDYVRSKDITLHDIIYQIGNFTKQLALKWAEKYQARKDSVFIMGGSAGGHLTGVVGLGYNDLYFAGNFSEDLTIKGIIPYYPANDAEKHFTSGKRDDLIPGDPDSNPLAFEKFTPSNLVDENDPSGIIFQGLQDRLVNYQESRDIEKAMENEDLRCLLLEFPFAHHANDFIASSNFQQIFLYYLERFLYLEQ